MLKFTDKGTPQFGTIFDRLTVYPSPYIVLTNEGYTKHYYAGTERIATTFGNGGFGKMTSIIDDACYKPEGLREGLYKYNGISYPLGRAMIKSDVIATTEIDGTTYEEWKKPQVCDLQQLKVECSQDYLLGCIRKNRVTNDSKENIFYFHGNHLGSASWITDSTGNPVQYMHYAPYGELLANQQTIGYDERFKFTGKERDQESGYDYVVARYYDHRKGSWNSVDPLADKYPGNTPYLYCNGNPVMLVDPDGKKCRVVQDLDGNYHVYAYIFYHQNGKASAERACAFWNNLTGKTYTTKDGKSHSVTFHLVALDIRYAKNAYKMARELAAENTYNVESSLGTSKNVPNATVAGHAKSNSATVAKAYLDKTTPEHELGHLLMGINDVNNPDAEHIDPNQKGIMTPDGKDPGRTKDVSQITIDRIIESNDIQKPSFLRQWIHDFLGL